MNTFLKNIFQHDRVLGFSIILSLFIHSLLFLNFSFRFPEIRNPRLVYIPVRPSKIRPSYLPVKKAPPFKDRHDLPASVPKDVEIGMGRTMLKATPPEKKISKLMPVEGISSVRINRKVKDISDNMFKNMINLEKVPPDPSIRAYYLNYYQSIRLKIRQIAYRKYRQDMPQGDVFLSFALDRNGRLISAFVDRGQSTADYDLCRIALDSLQQACPFEPFPKELIQDELSFNVIVSFRRK